MSLLKAFNSHFIEFLEDVLHVFPDDKYLRTAITFSKHLTKINPSLIIKCWQDYVVNPYGKNIKNGDFDFFLKKDYTDDLGTSKQYNSTKLLKIISNIKDKSSTMRDNNRANVIKYLQNLTKLCHLYYKVSL